MRGSYRYTQLSSCLIDLSYHPTLKIEVQDDKELLIFLEQAGFFKIFNREDVQLDQLDFEKVYTFDFYKPEINGDNSNSQNGSKLVSPCKIMLLSPKS